MKAGVTGCVLGRDRGFHSLLEVVPICPSPTFQELAEVEEGVGHVQLAMLPPS